MVEIGITLLENLDSVVLSSGLVEAQLDFRVGAGPEGAEQCVLA